MVHELPDVAVFDIQMPHLNGLDATRRVKREFPSVQVLILTAYEDDPYIFAALQAGASGYLLKTASAEEMIRAVRAIAAGETALSPSVARKLVQRATGGAFTQEQIFEPLSDRELEVLTSVARGERSKEIAVQLGISERTVKAHLASIYEKLGVDSRAGAIAIAAQKGILNNK